jgi:pyruvate/2-oxoglutarate/acetoin dehydrogenase E1 component
VPFGKARVLAKGKDITLVGISQMAIECLRARQYLQETGIEAEVVDPVSLSPLDISTIEASVVKTRKLIVVDNAWMPCGAGAEIITQLVEKNMHRNIEVYRMGFAFVPCPTTPALEQHFYPDAKKIASKAYEMISSKGTSWQPTTKLQIEEIEFKGPF